MKKSGHVLNGSFVLGIVFTSLLFGCAGAVFPYKFYKPQLKSWEGVLLGDRPENDLDAVQACSPDEQTDGKCVIMQSAEFFKFKTEYLDLQQRLIDCERH